MTRMVKLVSGGQLYEAAFVRLITFVITRVEASTFRKEMTNNQMTGVYVHYDVKR